MVSMYGIFSSFIVLQSVILVKVLGLDKLTTAFGVLALFEGVGKLPK